MSTVTDPGPGPRTDPGTDPRTDTARPFWASVLATAGSTVIPRWTLEPAAGVAEYEAEIRGALVAGLARTARELGVPPSSLLLAAHAVVLAALSGEREVVTGYVYDAGRAALPCPLTTGPATWREVVLRVRRVESGLLRHGDALEDLRREHGFELPSFETVFDPAGDRDLDEGALLRIGATLAGGRLVLRLRYHMEAIDRDYAARISAYHVRALELLVADPDGEHARQSLLSDEELRVQIEGLAGPRRALPDRRAHQLFEERVRAHPDRVAVVHADGGWTYAELNARANRIGRALLARGLSRENVVAVVTERDLDWAAAVLAIFKVGGAYLPIEPGFPAERIATTLRRAGCELVLTEAGSRHTLDTAVASLPGVEVLSIHGAYEEDHPDDDLGVQVRPDQLAYIYFTSGSTGEPKGAMCEHAGMLNHLLAKIEDLGIGEGTVVAQTAPQCFDISLWQLISALLVGGRTLLVEQDAILDVPRFLETIADGRVAVLQLVPSYLEAVLSALERHPRELADLRVVSVTGEALKKELTQRWFAAQPGIRLVNAYGLTETSDDTNHEVLDRVPDRDRVPLGRPINNVHVYVVDDNLVPVPLGTPGLIVFSGICVGRGYVNDPERTRQAYLADPHRLGQRLYRGGDYGRWLPEGKLEFLGRRDSQVKINGFRIEIGEIENALLRVQGVRDGAVVVTERPGQARRLVAFYTAPQPLDADVLRERLSATLPAYMVPGAFHWRQDLPLTANSKIDRKRLLALALELEVAAEYSAPRTPTERRLAAAWSRVLGIHEERIGRQDNFFDMGGNSLSAVKVVIALDRAVSLKDLTRHPVLADLAATVDGTSVRRTELLQSLSDAADDGAGVVVCFPPAGGNAVTFQPMARALRGTGLAVLAVELPGHDLAAEREPFARFEQVVQEVADEVTARGPLRVLLWGHSSGTAFALGTARRLHARGVRVERVFLAAQLPGTTEQRRRAAAELSRRPDADLVAALSAESGYTDLGRQDAHRAEHLAAAYRHDCLSAHEYLATTLDSPPADRLACPVTVVVAADDPYASAAGQRYHEWERLAERVELHELAGGGHHFLRTRSAEAAALVVRAAGLRTSS